MKAGQFLHASCSDTYFPILRVGEDSNGTPTMDIEVENINDFIQCRWYPDCDDEIEGNQLNRCMNIMTVEHTGPVIFRDLQYKDGGFLFGFNWVTCNTPGNGCYRCTELFSVRNTKNDPVPSWNEISEEMKDGNICDG